MFAGRRTVTYFLIGLLALLVLWFVAVYRPQTSRLEKADLERVEADLSFDQILDQISLLQISSQDGADKEAQLAKAKGYVPDTIDLGGLIRSSDQVATASGVSLLNVAPVQPTSNRRSAVTGQSAQAGGITEVPVSYSISGSYQQVVTFLEGLQTMERMVAVDDVLISTTGTNLLTAEISARAFTTERIASSSSSTPTTTPSSTQTTVAGG